MISTTPLTEQDREWRIAILDELAAVEAAILKINGPYRETRDALAALKRASGAAIDDEDIGPCETCGEPIWIGAGDDYVASEEGCRFCMACIARWNEDAPPKGTP